MSYYIMVLNDGETYTDLHGCMMMEMPDNADEYDIPEKCQLIRRFGPEPRAQDYLPTNDLIGDLMKVKIHLMAHDGWRKADVDTINEAIKRLQ